ncbi:hypothetical protein AAY473_019317 [Plecturocebus cupreus]
MWHSDTVTGNGKALRITLLTTLPPALSAYHSRHSAATRAPSRAPPPLLAAAGPPAPGPAPTAAAAILSDRPPLPARLTARRRAGAGLGRGRRSGLRRFPLVAESVRHPPAPADAPATTSRVQAPPTVDALPARAEPRPEAEEGDADLDPRCATRDVGGPGVRRASHRRRLFVGQTSGPRRGVHGHPLTRFLIPSGWWRRTPKTEVQNGEATCLRLPCHSGPWPWQRPWTPVSKALQEEEVPGPDP